MEHIKRALEQEELGKPPGNTVFGAFGEDQAY
jgi:hypothetical protein